MLRRYERIAGGASLWSGRYMKVARFILVVLACLAVPTAVSQTALAAVPDRKPIPQELWAAFPLNPNGERLAPSGTASRPISPVRDQQRNEAGSEIAAPVLDEAVSPASRWEARGLAYLAGVSLVAALGSVGVLWVLRTASELPANVVPLRPGRGGRWPALRAEFDVLSFESPYACEHGDVGSGPLRLTRCGAVRTRPSPVNCRFEERKLAGG